MPLLARALLVVCLLALARAGWAWGFSSAPAAPRFAVVPASTYKSGRDQLELISSEAEKEGFLYRVLGTNCFTIAVTELKAECRRITQEQKSRLALELVNCHQAVHGGQTYPCGRRQTLKQCTESLPDRMWTLYVEFLSHADSMCLFIQNQQFEKYTENMLNKLSEGALYAREQLASIGGATAAISKDTAELQSRAGQALELLQQQQELGRVTFETAQHARDEAAEHFESLHAKQDRGLQLADLSLSKAQELAQGQEAAAAALTAGREQVAAMFGLLDEKSTALAAAQEQHSQVQRAVTRELQSLANESRGLRSAVDVIVTYQQRSDAVLVRLLGKSYSLEDAAFYLGGGLAAAATSLWPSLAPARLPIVALLGASLVGERLLLDRLSFWLEVSPEGDRVVLPMARWLPFLPGADSLGAVDVKWGLRKLASALGAALLLYHLAVHKNYEKESFRLLQRLEEESKLRAEDEKLRHNAVICMLKQQRMELLSALSGGGHSAGQQGQHYGSKQGGRAAEAQAAWDLETLSRPFSELEGIPALAAEQRPVVLGVRPERLMLPAPQQGAGCSSEHQAGMVAHTVRTQAAQQQQPAEASRPNMPTPARASGPRAAARHQQHEAPPVMEQPIALRTRRRSSSDGTEDTAEVAGRSKRRGSRQSARPSLLEPVAEEADRAGQQAQRTKRGRKSTAESGGGKRARRQQMA